VDDPVPDLEHRIVYREGGVLVVNKPPRLPTAGRTLKDPDCLQFWLERYTRRRTWAVHQLDADTTGVNVFVTRKSLVAVWQRRMRFPNARKRYLAIIHGAPEWERTRVDAPIGWMQAGRTGRWGVTDDGKSAATVFERLDQAGDYALVSATLETGRTHQIRVHLQHLGLSLVGEEWYRDPPCTEHPRQALHAADITFRDGLDPGRLEAPLAPDLVDLAVRLGLEVP
jgi:23S rRNA-/tRNA-specific pseudouridylate synthase